MIINAYRVEITNYHSNFEKLRFGWTAEIHYSQGKYKAKVYSPTKIGKYIDDDLKSKIGLYIEQIRPSLSSFNEFQRIYCMTDAERKEQKLIGPFELLESIKDFLQDTVPIKEWDEPIKISHGYPNIPKVLTIGYFILAEVIKEMGGISR
jgi:DNA (cytosine-5)-methyltransferase 1